MVNHGSKTRKRKIHYKLQNNTSKKNNMVRMPTAFKNITAEISVSALKFNLDYLRKKAKTDIMPILKANAYGHGIVQMAKTCRQLGIKFLGVATLGEAMQIRLSGDQGRILGWIYDPHTPQVRLAVKHKIDVAIFDETHIPLILKQLPKNALANIHLFVDTGMNRLGVPHQKALAAAQQITASPKFKLVGLMSHLCCADEKNNKNVKEALAQFRLIRQQLADHGIKPPIVHIANSDAVLNYDVSDFTLARSGSGFYGHSSLDLQLAMTLKSKIIQLKHIAKGAGVGYNLKYVAKHRKYIAIVPTGYADILPLTKSEKLQVYVNGTMRKVLGKESMDQIVIEAHENDKLGDEVIFFDGKHITLPKFCFMAKTTDANLLTHLSERVDRVYVP